ncbi:MAG: zinc-ribbon domain-containing protein, partial [Candidatus Eremiobacteraeota bacterium]|nr:zinc-ribbon domain-containing protein [Candidatus Eremiobacteraeota bacterium]
MAGYCIRCGAQLPEGANFCNECGAPIISSATEQHAPLQPQQLPKQVEPAEQKYDGFAIASFICSLTIIFWWLGLILGIISLVRLGQNKRLKGMWMAIIGIVAGPVLGIMMIMAAILVPNFMRARASGQATACKANLKNIATALEMYATDNDGRYPETIHDLSDYLRPIPVCPVSGRSYGYEVNSDHSAYTIWCKGGFHTAAGIEE